MQKWSSNTWCVDIYYKTVIQTTIYNHMNTHKSWHSQSYPNLPRQWYFLYKEHIQLNTPAQYDLAENTPHGCQQGVRKLEVRHMHATAQNWDFVFPLQNIQPLLHQHISWRVHHTSKAARKQQALSVNWKLNSEEPTVWVEKTSLQTVTSIKWPRPQHMIRHDLWTF